MKIISKEFGGNDDVSFLKVVWNMSLKDIKTLLADTAEDLTRLKQSQSKGKIMGVFDKKSLSIIKSRIPWIKQILASKKKTPDFIPDSFKSQKVMNVPYIIETTSTSINSTTVWYKNKWKNLWLKIKFLFKKPEEVKRLEKYCKKEINSKYYQKIKITNE